MCVEWFEYLWLWPSSIRSIHRNVRKIIGFLARYVSCSLRHLMHLVGQESGEEEDAYAEGEGV